MKLRVAAALAALPILASCGSPPGQVAINAHTAYTRLVASELPDFVMNRQCGILIHIRAEGEPDKSVTWHVTSSGHEMLSFSAKLTPVDATHTKIAVTVSSDGEGHEAYD